MNKTEIHNKSDIKLFVDEFYSRVRADDLIGPIFEARIADRWPIHLEKMYSFWNSSLFGEADYRGHPFRPHASMPIDGPHFERWLSLMRATIEERFTGEKAEEIKWRAERMAEMFQVKLKYVRDNGFKPIV